MLPKRKKMCSNIWTLAHQTLLRFWDAQRSLTYLRLVSKLSENHHWGHWYSWQTRNHESSTNVHFQSFKKPSLPLNGNAIGIAWGHTFWCPVFNTYDNVILGVSISLMMVPFCHLPFCLFQTVSNHGSYENRFKTVALYDPHIHGWPDATYGLRCTKIFHLHANGFNAVRQPPLRQPIFQAHNKSCITNKVPFSELWKTINSTA